MSKIAPYNFFRFSKNYLSNNKKSKKLLKCQKNL